MEFRLQIIANFFLKRYQTFIFCIVSAALLIPSTNSWAQDSLRPSFLQRSLGFYAHGPLSTGSKFSLIPGLPEASDSAGALSGFTIGASALFPLLHNKWSVGLNFDVMLLSGLFHARSTANPQTIYQANVSLNSVNISPGIWYNLYDAFTVYAGLQVGFVGHTSLRLTDSTQGGSATSRAISSVSSIRPLQIAALFGAGYTLPISRDDGIGIRPELTLQVPISPFSNDGSSWSEVFPKFRVGVAVLFSTEAPRNKIPAKLDTLFIRDTTIQLVESYRPSHIQRISQSINLPMPSSGKQEETLSLWIERLVFGTTDTTLMNTDVPSNTVLVREMYIRAIPKPKPIMAASVEAEFILPDGKKERFARVKAEKTLLRLYLPPPALPQVAVLKDTALKPYSVSDTLWTSRLPKVRFFPRIIAEQPVQSWRLEILQNLQTITTFSGASNAVEVLEWNPTEDSDILIRANEQLLYRFFVVTHEGQTVMADSGMIKVESEPPSIKGLQRLIDMVFLEQVSSANAKEQHIQSRLLQTALKLIKAQSVVRLVVNNTEQEAKRLQDIIVNNTNIQRNKIKIVQKNTNATVRSGQIIVIIENN